MLDKCFERDWLNSSIEKSLKYKPVSEMIQVREKLREFYPLIREAYKFYAGIIPSGIVPSIGQNILTEMVLSMHDNFIDYKSLKLSDLDLIVISVKATGLK